MRPATSGWVETTVSGTTTWCALPLIVSVSALTHTEKSLPWARPEASLVIVTCQVSAPIARDSVVLTEASVPVPWSTASTRPEPSSTTYPDWQVVVTVRVWPGSRSRCTSDFCTSSWCRWSGPDATASTVAVMVDVRVAPDGTVPRSQVTVDPTVAHGWLADTKVTPPGRTSRSVTSCAGPAPTFVTASV